MQLFLDTGNIEEIKIAAKWGVVDGVTTNPSLIAKTGRGIKAVISDICEIIDGPISAEVISTEKEKMLEEARILANINPNIVIKLPLTHDGISALKVLSSENIATNLTLCFSTSQALLAAKNGATYISPFIGRLDDIGADGVELIKEIKTIYKNYNFKTKILSASIRNIDHVKNVLLIGSDIATIPFKVLDEMFRHPLTDKGLKKFLEDYKLSK